MILTYKAKHDKDFSVELEKAKRVAEFAVLHKGEKFSSSQVKDIGLKSAISNQILRKYGFSSTIKKAKRVNLTIPSQQIKFDKAGKFAYLPLLKLKIPLLFDLSNVTKINQIEINREFCFISCETTEVKSQQFIGSIGIDLNSTSHSIVIANTATGKVKKYGREIPHLKKSRAKLRKSLQEKKDYRRLRQVSRNEQNKTKDLLHKITTSIVKEAVSTRSNIKLENLKGIRQKKTTKFNKSANFTLNSWPFFEIKRLLEYKAKKYGITIIEVNPAFTSQRCSRCGELGDRNRKSFSCKNEKCKHFDHSDVNAAFNIASLTTCNSALKSKSNIEKNEILNTGTEELSSSKLESRESDKPESGLTLEPPMLSKIASQSLI